MATGWGNFAGSDLRVLTKKRGLGRYANLETKWRKGLNFKDITIVNDKLGKPGYEISSNVKKLIYLKFKTRKIKISLSLADEKNYSIAFSVIHK